MFPLFILLLNFLHSTGPTLHGQNVDTVEQLVMAVNEGQAGATIKIAEGTYRLSAPLKPAAGMVITGAGMGKTIITHVEDWKPATDTLPDPEMRIEGLDRDAYLIRLQDDAAGIEISQLSLRGPQMHGAIFGWANQDLHLHHLQIDDTLWSGIRTFLMQNAKIHDCEFIDAGGRWDQGQAGVNGGITGGAIFAIWMKDCEIYHNRFRRTQTARQDEFYGIKCRQAKRCRIHHNTIEVNFSMEFPFENDEDVQIDHNICLGTVSIPKHAGGPVPSSGTTFHIHHNYFRDSYAIEFVRNGVEMDHNFFDFDPAKDHGNLISGFGKAPASGPAVFHNNVIKNPGRGVVWINEPYNHLVVRNNYIIANTTATPRDEGLFGFDAACDFSTIQIRNNYIQCVGQSRPLLRNEESYGAQIENNRLINISDHARFNDSQTDQMIGLEQALEFECGVHGEKSVREKMPKP